MRLHPYRRALLAAGVLLGFIGSAHAQSPFTDPPSNPVTALPYSTTGGGGVAVTVTNSSAQAIAAATVPRKLVAIDNESTTATIACSFGGTAAINTAGSWTIPPGSTRTWTGPFVPMDAIQCISSAASSPATIEAN